MIATTQVAKPVIVATLAAAVSCTADIAHPTEIAVLPVYGTDDRQEYFEATTTEIRSRMAASVVALIPKASLGKTEHPLADAATLGTLEGLCPTERFADQPAAAFCTGVLVDWDLVLTAGHCVRLLAPQDFAAVFNYAYSSPGVLAATQADIVDVEKIVDEALDPIGQEPRLDYAWLRLANPVRPPHEPAPLYGRSSPLKLDDPLISIGASGGIPLKIDTGGRVRDVREKSSDYFVADTDTFHGSSGGGAFDEKLALVGIAARGGVDSYVTEQGCRATRIVADGSAEEQFTYAHRATEGLCKKDPSASTICRQDCGDPCQAVPPPAEAVAGGCSEVVARPSVPTGLALLLMLVPLRLRRRSREQTNRIAAPSAP